MRNKQVVKTVLLKNKHGVAIFLVIGVIAICVPVMYMLSQLGSSSTKSMLKYSDYLKAEQVAQDGNTAIISMLRNDPTEEENDDGSINKREYEPQHGSLSGQDLFDAVTYKTGLGFLNQELRIIITKPSIGSTYTLISDVEQFWPDPNPPVITVSNNFWGTVEQCDLTAAADVLSLQNNRGIELLRFGDIQQDEQDTTDKALYKDRFLAMKEYLPEEIAQNWNEIADIITEDKMN